MCTISRRDLSETKKDETIKKVYRRNAIIPNFSFPRKSQMTEGSDALRKSNVMPSLGLANLLKMAPRNSGMLNSGSGGREQINRASFITAQQVLSARNSEAEANENQLDLTLNNKVLKRRITFTKQGKQQFYERMRQNKAIVVPEGPLLDEAMRLQGPCF